MRMTEIAFVDLKAQYERLKPEIMGAINEVLEDRAFIQGRHAAKFAQEFCSLLGLPYGTGCSNGTPRSPSHSRRSASAVATR